MKQKINEFWNDLEYRLKQLCGRPTPFKRLIMVIFICVAFGAVNVWFVYSSIYNIGKKDAEKEFLKMRHIEGLPFPNNDSINHLKQKIYQYEYE